MPTLIDCLKLYGIKGSEAAQFIKKAEGYTKEKYNGREANINAVSDILRETESNKAEVIKQIKEELSNRVDKIEEPKGPSDADLKAIEEEPVIPKHRAE